MTTKKSKYSEEAPLLGDAIRNDYGAAVQNGNDHIINVLEEREDTSEPAEGFTLLFKFATRSERLLMFLGTLFAILSGILSPICALFFGGMTDVFIKEARYGLIPDKLVNPDLNDTSINKTLLALTFNTALGDVYENKDKILYEKKYIIEELFAIDDPLARFGNDTAVTPLTFSLFKFFLIKYSIIYVGIGTLMMLFCFLQAYFWKLAGERIVYNIRIKYLSEVLRKDISWHDQNDSEKFTNKFADDVEKIRDGIGQKCALIVQTTSTFVAGIVVGLYVNRYLTLIVWCAMLFVIGLSAFTSRFARRSVTRERKKYAPAGSVVQEALANIKIVNAHCGRRENVKKYNYWLKKGMNESGKNNMLLALLVGLVFFLIYFIYALGFATGSYQIRRGFSSPGSVFAVFLSVVAGTIAIIQSRPHWAAISKSIGIISFVDKIIERKSLIDPHAKTGRKFSRLAGKIEFKNTSFVHPSTSTVKVLDGLNLVIEPDQRIAIVGPSGPANSAIFSLLLRFYDPTAGEVFVDDVDVSDYNVRWLRQQIGLVSREPVLFDGVSIAENIMYGTEDVSLDDVIDVTKEVNVHDFINELPKGYDTIVGDTTLQLSEGQKQKIVIARALIRNPKILLLEEETNSSEGATSENIEQDILEKVMEGRTTVMVTHRLSTITRADIIYVLQDGKPVESGTHEELVLAQNSLYYELLQKTQLYEAHHTSSQIIKTVVDNVEIEDENVLLSVDSEGSRESLEIGDTKRLLSDAKYRKEPERLPETIEDITTWELIKLQLTEWPWFILGTIGSIGSGLVTPLLALCFGAMFHVFTLSGTTFLEASTFWTNVFLGFSVFCGVIYSIQYFGLSYANTRMVNRMRALVFENVLRQPAGWFDLNASSPGTLVNILTQDPLLVQAGIANKAGQILSYTITGITATLIAFFYCWKLALCLAIVTSLIMELTVKHRGVRGFYCTAPSDSYEKLMDDAKKVASKLVKNIRTVQALGQERLITESFTKYLEAAYRAGKKEALRNALLYAAISGLIFYMYAVAFSVGGCLVESGEMKSEDVYRVFFAFSLCTSIIGTSFLFTQEQSEARHSIRSLNFLRKRKTEIDPNSKYGAKPLIKGTVEFKDVHFSYPSQPTVRVFKGLNLHVEAGKTLALVGESGCGKSTIMSLLERFYNPDHGNILVDGSDIRDLNLDHLRSNIGFVPQEPVLLDASVKDNIQYGVVAPEEVVPFDLIIRAARATHLHEFIMSLPQRYDTVIGKNGVQLSHDQIVKVAIARILVRKPKILLFDDVTSALDAENEKIVQAALDEANKVGRTCIMVTRHLPTIRKADIVCVLQNGRIVEWGTSQELEEVKGHYFQLIERRILI